MMSKCKNCCTSWTSLGMPICPICGTKVDESLSPSGIMKALERKNGRAADPPSAITAVLEAPTETVVLRAADPDPGPEKLDFAVETIMLKSVPTLDVPKKAPEAPSNVEDASVILLGSAPHDADLPDPVHPLNGPIILGSLALVTVVLLPLAAAFESSRVFGVLGFCLSGFFLPFSPIAWIVGLGAEQRRREQRLRPERRVVIGRLLGQWGTLLLIAEGTIGLLLVAALRLGGKLPATFWAS